MQKKISVVVPVHNVEDYITDCLNSILHQSFTDYEAILVVNNSTDDSERICREFAAKDSRFSVLTSEIGDLSTARNIGIANSVGEYICFVDSDDILTCDYLEMFYKIMDENDADMAICSFKPVPQETTFEKQTTGEINNLKIYSNKEIMNLFFTHHETKFVTTWNKIYKRELFDNIEFPPKRKNEDEFVAHLFMYASKNIAVIDNSLYLYRTRQGSIMHTISGSRYIDCADAYTGRTDFFMQKNENHLALNSCIFSLRWIVRFYYNICSSDSFASIHLKKAFDKEYEIYNKINDNSVDVDHATLEFYKTFKNSPVVAHKQYLRLEYMDYKKKTPTLEVMKNNLRNIKNNMRFNMKKNLLFAYIRSNHKLNILNTKDSLDILCSGNKGICRFGDGELTLINGTAIGFQEANPKLAQRLKEILNDADAPCYIAIPDEINMIDYDNQTQKSRRYWIWHMLHERKTWQKVCNPKTQYLTTNVTRPYMRYFDKSACPSYFTKLSTLWKGKDILIVEGEKSRLGIGNDLFDGANIERILAPSTNSFDKYDSILSLIKEHANGRPVFIALGPCATILAYDLCKAGITAYDIGHCDIEYEWMLARTDTKIAIPSKFTNEADGGNIVDDCLDETYKSQIIARV